MDQNRNIVLFGTIIAQFGLGSIYTWSLFNSQLAEFEHAALPNITLTFSIISFALAFSTLFSGKLQEYLGIKKVVILCAIGLGLGLVFIPKTHSLIMLYICGIIVGASDGIAYMLTLSNCMKWFPDKKGVISGISVGAYGLGSLGFKYINVALLKSVGLEASFMYWGILTFALVFIGALLLKDAVVKTTATRNNQGQIKEFTPKQLFSSPQAYLLFICFLASCLSGLYVIGIAKNIGVEFAHVSLEDAANAVAIIAIFNTLGRFIFGWLSEKIERTKVSALGFVIIAISVSIILFVPLNYSLFLLSVGGIAFSFGGNLPVFPAIVGEYFGLQNHTKNYGIIYQGFGIGGLLGGAIASIMGSFTATFYLILVFSIIAAIIMLSLKSPQNP
ncbi:L-lactate MFS transporter [Actinobacillus delphinicola]|uniref:Putative oxalate/formate antiporter n=1 Tax=Actinobacillus delphinicola TaxID=51161 RepID=A0A448TSR8_9PAST|nr:OFA family MFS transporter [Actinobacillus delphinicola]VEJ08945.1 putative oxalate/formate antiporter [Actinobacillus delphinicola]